MENQLILLFKNLAKVINVMFSTIGLPKALPNHLFSILCGLAVTSQSDYPHQNRGEIDGSHIEIRNSLSYRSFLRYSVTNLTKNRIYVYLVTHTLAPIGNTDESSSLSYVLS